MLDAVHQRVRITTRCIIVPKLVSSLAIKYEYLLPPVAEKDICWLKQKVIENVEISQLFMWKKQSVPLSSNILETEQAHCRSDKLSLKLQSYNCRVETSGTRIHN